MSKNDCTDSRVTANKPDNAIVRYFKETRAEIRKVSWPTREEATNLTVIVLGVTVAMAIFLGAVDLHLRHVDPADSQLTLNELGSCGKWMVE